jgi:DNA-directed RNA polymerase specialized sigma24 family protein
VPSGGPPTTWSEVWAVEYPRAERLVARRLPGRLRCEVDPADLVQDAAASILAASREPGPGLLCGASVRRLQDRCRAASAGRRGGRWHRSPRGARWRRSGGVPDVAAPAAATDPSLPAEAAEALEAILSRCRTDAERRVVRLKAEGLTDVEVGEALSLDPQRVRRAVGRLADAGRRDGRAKLTPAKALEIRRRALAGERTTDLAREFGVSRKAVYKVAKGMCWAGAGLET